MPEFSSNGASVHYELLGSGPPVLLVAGIASDGASWGPLLPLLADRFRLIMIDNRGCGRTRADGEIDIEDMVGDCVALLDHLRIEQTAVVGHSMGGMIAQRLTLGHPRRVLRLVTLTTPTVIGPRERVLFHDLAQVYLTNPPQLFFRLLYPWLFSQSFFADPQRVADAAEASTAYPHRQSPADFARQVAAVDRIEPHDLSGITCPVLAIAAENDLLVPAAQAFTAPAAVRHVQTMTVDAAAHSVHWEAPNAVAEAIRNFLR
jgi:aminoacrylate hydrolase